MNHDARVMGFDPATGSDTSTFIYRCVKCGTMDVKPLDDSQCNKPGDLTMLIKRIDAVIAKWQVKRKHYITMNKMSSREQQQTYYLSLQGKPDTTPGDDLQ